MPVHGGIYEIWLGSSTLLGSIFHLHSYQKSASIFLFVGLAMPYGKPDKESLVLSDFLFSIKKGPCGALSIIFKRKLFAQLASLAQSQATNRSQSQSFQTQNQT